MEVEGQHTARMLEHPLASAGTCGDLCGPNRLSCSQCCSCRPTLCTGPRRTTSRRFRRSDLSTARCAPPTVPHAMTLMGPAVRPRASPACKRGLWLLGHPRAPVSCVRSVRAHQPGERVRATRRCLFHGLWAIALPPAAHGHLTHGRRPWLCQRKRQTHEFSRTHGRRPPAAGRGSRSS